jgi:hypothetical protein
MAAAQGNPTRADGPKPTQHGSYLLRARGKDSFTERYFCAIRQGLNKTHAAVTAGCNPSTVRECERLAAECMETINHAIEKGDWRAAPWVLERNAYRAPMQADHSVEVKTGFYYMNEQDRQA